jgi:hypothetical protein
MIRRSLRQIVTALVLLVAFICQGTWALAGTTGGLTGTVVDATSSAPIAGAVVTVSSPSQTASVTTDASGRFGFLTLAPDTYTVSVTKDQFQPTSASGQIVFADTVQSLTIRLQKALTTIAHVTATGAGNLVHSGTTADVYSVNAAGQQAASAVGGGGSLNSAYSAISTVPGAYVPMNQTGYYQSVHIRGGDYDQVGYEFDGVPVNRSFDNYPSSSASSLGNAEVQVYTGANPANSEGQGLSGYINQVIRTGTYPGFGDGQLGIGTPAFYHRAEVEAGGATPDRLFSYYVGVAGYNQAFNYVDNSNGAGYDNWLGTPMAPQVDPNVAGCNGTVPNIGGPGQTCGGGFFLGALQYGALAAITARDVVVNTHFAIPHHHDGGRDDVQLLWDSEMLFNDFYNSTNDIVSTQGCGGLTTGAACANAIGLGQPVFLDGYAYNCQGDVGGTFSSGALNAQGQKCVGTYYFPSSTNRTSAFQPIPVNSGDNIWNNQEIVKLQYTHNMGSNAYFRIYGYTYYSNWLQNGPQTSYADYFGCCAPDYELSSHTRGLSASFSDQVNAQNLVSLQASYVTANSVRDNNSQMFNFTTGRKYAAVLVNAGEPYAGFCYNTGGGAAQSCSPGAATSWVTWAGLQAGAAPSSAGTCQLTGSPNQGCAYLLAENSSYATYNAVRPQFFSSSLTDEFRPSDKWLFNLGIRLDSFTFNGQDTNQGPARQFFFNAYNNDNCINHLTGAPYANAPGTACPNGDKHAYLQNLSAQSFTFNIWQPRVSGTYTINADSVVRFSFGRYTQAPNAAFEQYNTLQNDLPFTLLGPNFLQYGRNAPGLPIAPPTSLNYDVSLEQRLHGTDWSFKLTPFLRQTQDQIQQFFLNQKTGFVSGTNIGSQRSEGFEFQAQKGDFSRNGIAGLLSFAYTNSYVKYGTVNPYGATILTPINATISQYNAYTKACAPGGAYYGKSQYGQPLCGSTTTGVVAAPCFSPTGAPAQPLAGGACPAGDIQNPYWNAPGQGFLNPGQNFPTYDIIPSGIGSSADAYGAPYVATLLLNYKHDKFAITPSFQFQGGGKYGAPMTTPGIDPAAGCGAPLAGTQRYNAGNPGCATNLTIPDPYTGVYDGLGSFTQPNSFGLNLQLSYDVSPRVQLVGTLANIVNGCWGGTKAPWTFTDGNLCSYGIVGGGAIPPIGNAYNPAGYAHSIVPAFQKYPYAPGFGPYNDDGNSTKTPFQFYVSAKIKL